MTEEESSLLQSLFLYLRPSMCDYIEAITWQTFQRVVLLTILWACAKPAGKYKLAGITSKYTRDCRIAAHHGLQFWSLSRWKPFTLPRKKYYCKQSRESGNEEKQEAMDLPVGDCWRGCQLSWRLSQLNRSLSFCVYLSGWWVAQLVFARWDTACSALSSLACSSYCHIHTSRSHLSTSEICKDRLNSLPQRSKLKRATFTCSKARWHHCPVFQMELGSLHCHFLEMSSLVTVVEQSISQAYTVSYI